MKKASLPVTEERPCSIRFYKELYPFHQIIAESIQVFHTNHVVLEQGEYYQAHI